MSNDYHEKPVKGVEAKKEREKAKNAKVKQGSIGLSLFMVVIFYFIAPYSRESIFIFMRFTISSFSRFSLVI